ncbi:MAG: phosphopyruvate hydratase [Patescibacteria group bacterium]
MKIAHIHAREVFDSRGTPTLEAEVTTEHDIVGRAIVPSGASTGTHEAHELRDNDEKRFGGKGVLKAVRHVNEDIARTLIGMPIDAQETIDEALITLDGTPNKKRLGANALLGVSLATAHAAAKEKNIPLYEYASLLSEEKREPVLPLPLINILNGGAHTLWESTDIQEFMIAPVGADSFSHALQMSAEIFHALKGVLKEAGYGTGVGDEGGFAPALKDGNEEAFARIAEAVGNAGYVLGSDVVFALDSAASEFHRGESYALPLAGRTLTSDEMISWYRSLSKKFPIASLEDGLAEGDWDGWRLLTRELGDTMQLVGDDLLVTNTTFLNRAIEEKAGNAILIKVNQIGTLTETIRAVDSAHRAGWRTVMSHRSGETEDTTIAHLAVGLGCGQIKTGSLSRSDRVAKYNELLRIEERLGDRAVFAGNVFLTNN